MTQPPSPLATPVAWEMVAGDYAVDVVPHFERYAADALRLAAIGPGARVLDVAAGPGTLSLLAAREAQVTALDFSPAMVERLRERAARAGLAVDARVGDGMALPFEDGAFDAAFSMFGLMFFPDRDRGFRELFRVLRPGGRAVVGSWAPMDRSPIMDELFSALRAELPGLPFGEGKAPLGDPAEFRAEMEAAGFRDVSVREVEHAWEAASTEELWGSMRRSNAPLVLLRDKLGEARWDELGEAILARLQARFGEGPQRLGMVANLGAGTR
ncbi:methyltransferase domain-containing protein [Sorangium sp. So ce185]|uniref:class I SAM-dependent methyltransferase n=1 Tax=Sorangium sp. So ce185 TaxID=3133287 RepID=UPI003F643A50